MLRVAQPAPQVNVFCYGAPFDTGAFVAPSQEWDWRNGIAPKWCTIEEQQGAGFTVTIPLLQSDALVGLGQHMGPVGLRGQQFRLFAADVPVHTPAQRGMYGSHPFMIVLRDEPFGLFFDSPGPITIDAGVDDRESLVVRIEGPGFYLARIDGSSPASVVRSYLQLVGQPYVPPRWAFGFHQSRWSYADEAEVREIAAKMEQHNIPCDVIHLDIHYMKDYKVFTVDPQRFPDLSRLSDDLRARGIRLISIVDPGVKAESGYSVYEQGKELGYYCKRADGEGDFVAAVWPGATVLPDFFRPEVREWWGGLYMGLKEQGISGFWNDMNEPSIFYTPQAIKEFAGRMQALVEHEAYTEELGNMAFSPGLSGRESYYSEFCHTVGEAQVINRFVHNLYGTQMTRALAEALERSEPDKRHFVLSRSSYPGMHRYGAIWTGDNHSWWEHLALNVQMLISLNLTGFLFVGADTGGFGGDCTGEMLVRWTQLSAFAPFLRNHAAMWACPQEPWAFDDETLSLCRDAITMRYALMPYIYSEFVRSATHGEPFIRGTFFEFPQAQRRLNDGQFFCGRALLVAPLMEAAVEGRDVHLPQQPWLKVSHGPTGLAGESVWPAGSAFAEAPLAEIPLFLRLGSLVPMCPPPRNLSAEAPSSYRLLGFTDTSASCEILLDDGETRYASWRDYPKLVCTVTRDSGKLCCSAVFKAAAPRPITLELEVWDSCGGRQTLHIELSAAIETP